MNLELVVVASVTPDSSELNSYFQECFLQIAVFPIFCFNTYICELHLLNRTSIEEHLLNRTSIEEHLLNRNMILYFQSQTSICFVIFINRL